MLRLETAAIEWIDRGPEKPGQAVLKPVIIDGLSGLSNRSAAIANRDACPLGP